MAATALTTATPLEVIFFCKDDKSLFGFVEILGVEGACGK
jgi:hypothetical protein